MKLLSRAKWPYGEELKKNDMLNAQGCGESYGRVKPETIDKAVERVLQSS